MNETILTLIKDSLYKSKTLKNMILLVSIAEKPNGILVGPSAGKRYYIVVRDFNIHITRLQDFNVTNPRDSLKTVKKIPIGDPQMDEKVVTFLEENLTTIVA